MGFLREELCAEIRMFEGKVEYSSYILLKFGQANSSNATRIRRDSLAGRRDIDRSLAVVAERDASGLHTRRIKPGSISTKIDEQATESVFL